MALWRQRDTAEYLAEMLSYKKVKKGTQAYKDMAMMSNNQKHPGDLW